MCESQPPSPPSTLATIEYVFGVMTVERGSSQSESNSFRCIVIRLFFQ